MTLTPVARTAAAAMIVLTAGALDAQVTPDRLLRASAEPQNAIAAMPCPAALLV